MSLLRGLQPSSSFPVYLLAIIKGREMILSLILHNIQQGREIIHWGLLQLGSSLALGLVLIIILWSGST